MHREEQDKKPSLCLQLPASPSVFMEKVLILQADPRDVQLPPGASAPAAFPLDAQ